MLIKLSLFPVLQPGTYLDDREKHIKYRDFVHKELILFSIADLQRSIPSMVDGLKPGQRKILFCSFKRNFVKEAKVAQFSGYVSEHSAYHHGEQSLASTIIGMAQDYVGSNNINLLLPNGQFGTRGQVTNNRIILAFFFFFKVLFIVKSSLGTHHKMYGLLFSGWQRSCQCEVHLHAAVFCYKIFVSKGR